MTKFRKGQHVSSACTEYVIITAHRNGAVTVKPLRWADGKLIPPKDAPIFRNVMPHNFAGGLQ